MSPAEGPVLVGLGANLPSPRFGPPAATLAPAIAAMEARGLAVRRRSPWYETEPVPISDQPWYVNGVVSLATSETPDNVLKILHEIEEDFARVRTVRNAPRVVDLDLLAHGGTVQPGPPRTLAVLPHPRLHERGFVLWPLADVAPGWRHPVSGLTVEEMLARLPPRPLVRPLAADVAKR